MPETVAYEPDWVEHEGEAYDINNPEDAWKYLMHVRGIELVKSRGWIDDITGGHYSHELTTVYRAAIYADGRPQSDADHAYIAADMSSIMLETLEVTDVDDGTASKMIVRHDRKEALAGDTSIFDEEGLKTKRAREKAAETIMKHEAKYTPGLIAQDHEYEECFTPTARWSHGVDGIEPSYQALKNKAALQRERKDKLDLMSRKQFEKTSIHGGTFAICLGIQMELARKWEDWDCLPHHGDRIAIVLDIAKDVFSQKAGIVQLEEYESARAIIKKKFGVQLPEMALAPQPDPATAEAAPSNLYDFAEAWEKRHGTPPPTPTAPLGAVALAAA